MNYIEQYHRAIKESKVIVGEWIRKLYDLIEKRLAEGDFFYDNSLAERAINFIEAFCRHSKGRNDLIKLELWQKALVALIFGIVERDGSRVFREVFCVVSRKNGKSIFASAITNYMAYMDKEYGAEIYSIAPKLDQAGIVFDGFYKMVTADPELSALAQKRRSDVYIATVNTTIKPLPFSAKKSDGLNPHLTVCDEISSWPAEQGLKQYEVIKSALGSRRQPLILSISTAGYVNDGPYDELMKRSTAVLNGNSKERRLLPVLYIIDDPKKWNDLDELKKSNPNMDVSVSRDFFVEEISIAENSLSKRIEFLTKYCNIKQNSTAAWLPYEVVDDCCGETFDLSQFEKTYAVAGIDLSQTTDLTACCVIIEKNEQLYVIAHFFIPENKIDELSEREGIPYRIYQTQGLLTASGENYVDYEDCFRWFVRLIKEYKIYPLKVGYDRYSSQYLIQQMKEAGFHCDDVYQGENLSPVIHEMEGLVRDGKLRLGQNNILKMHFLNTALKQNAETRKVRTCKIEQRAHIDGCMAVLDALTVRQKYYNEIGEQLKNKRRETG